MSGFLSFKIGAMVGGANQKDADLLYEFGRNIGLAFQLQDDLLDVYGDVNVFGKQIGGDIVANKKTFLLIKALELAKENILENLQSLLSEKSIDREQKVSAVTQIYNDLDIKKITQDRIVKLNNAALEYLNQVDVEDHKKSELKKLAEKLLNRIH